MKRILFILTLLFSFSVSSQAGTQVRITAKKVMGKAVKGKTQDLGSMSAKMDSRNLHYEFQLLSMSPKLSRVTAEWVMVLDAQGKLLPVSTGKRTLDLKMGHSVHLVTDDVSMKKLKLKNVPNLGDMDLEASIVGYGIRLIDANGAEVAAAYTPKKHAAEVKGMLGKVSKLPPKPPKPPFLP